MLLRLHRSAEFRSEVGLREVALGDHDLLDDDGRIDHVDLEGVRARVRDVELRAHPADIFLHVLVPVGTAGLERRTESGYASNSNSG